MRLDKELVERSLVRSRTLAASLIDSGAVRVNGRVVTKASYKVGFDDALTVAESDLTTYVSRAGHKLAGALASFPQVQVAGKRCLDAGASTGGFTEVLLEAGANRVAAVDVGHGQLADTIRQDSRVDVYEGMNVRYMEPADIGGPVELVVSDLSFISLTLVMGALAAATQTGGDLLLMIKPQFEVGKHQIGRAGVVTDPLARQQAIEKVKASAGEHGLTVQGVQESPLPGQDGNVEFFLWCTQG